MRPTKIVFTADDRKIGMTFDEIRGFVQSGLRNNVPGDAKVSVINGFHNQIKELSVEIPNGQEAVLDSQDQA